ncbi:DEAD/DEAH box helicase family protein [uncultured Treponema sp.]|uniref:DEAD/DEAH box helicase family protein n=1 Tax=uncultured Treponema sp. TaxID=162155 RepID=UPI00259685DF|nr:DEAD/DEAH box helicase family protein [uncultured Treponema sp.]
MNFTEINIKQEYRSPQDNIIKDFYIPVLENAVSYRRSVGFFSSSALIEISKGICELAKKGGKIELVASPYLSAEDEIAIRKGYENRAKIIENALLRGLKTEPENFFEKERLNLLANLVESGVLNIKIAFTENGSSVGMYHEKLGLVEDSGGNKIAFSGSMNESENAFTKNYETVDVFCSWKSTDEKARVVQKETAFAAIWGNFDEKLKVLHFPSIDKAILEKYKRGIADFELDKKEFSKDRNIMYKIRHGDKTVIPDMVAVAEADSVDAVFEDKLFFDFKGKKSPRPHQKKAIENFESNNFQTLLAMATGTGKTLTSLFCANELSKEIELTSVLIIVPLKDLVDQWQKDIEECFSGEIISIRSGLDWKGKLSDLRLMKILKKNDENQKIVIITTYDSFCGNDEKILESLNLNSTLIIADEVHKFGAASYSKKLPEKIRYRIGLSATPKRPYDEKGTKAIFDYFCPSENPYEFSIKDAIEADMLCHYEYHPTIVPLTDFEMEDYENISEKISRLSVIVNNSSNTAKEDEERLEQLLKERHRIIERAQNKKSEFLEIMQSEISKYKDRTIVFCPDGKDENGKDFLEVYKSELWNEFVSKGKIVRMSEYVQGTKREIIESFTAGAIDILFAKQRLNEGIDIPAAKRAFFIASSTSEREFIQRRGRVLRKSPETNKTLAEIFDFIVVPPDRNSVYAQSIVENEIKRAMDFAATADNYAEIEKILRKYL